MRIDTDTVAFVTILMTYTQNYNIETYLRITSVNEHVKRERIRGYLMEGGG